MEKHYSPPRIAPLQKVVGEPITDPEEQAALDRLRLPPEAVSDDGEPSPTTAAEALRLCRQLPVEERLALVTEMAALLPTDNMVALVERLLAALPPEVQQHEEGQLPSRQPG